MIPVYKKWLELGGTNLQVSVTTIQEGKNKSFYMSFQDVVDGKAGIEHPQGTLLTFGREFVDILEELATLYKKALTVQKMRPPLKGISDVLLRLAAFISKHRLAPVSHKVKEEDIKKAANDILEGKDLDEKLKIIFGFNGLKNEMHKELKEATKDPKSWPARDLIEFFGDIKFALDEFNRISAI